MEPPAPTTTSSDPGNPPGSTLDGHGRPLPKPGEDRSDGERRADPCAPLMKWRRS